MSVYQHWQLQKDADHIVWLVFNRADASVNTIDLAVLNELDQLLESFKQDQSIKGLVICSAKTSGFVAGADVNLFGKMTPADAGSFIERGQQVFDKLAHLTIPTLALINGFCLGGGLELALACRYRIAEEKPKVRLGAPEVLLGIQPGWGCTVRLPRLVGALKAMDLLLTGRAISAKAAKKIGLLDEVVPKRELERAARYYIQNQPPAHKPAWFDSATNIEPIRVILSSLLRKQLRAKVNKDHYPAPYSIVDTWEKNGVVHEKAFEAERNAIAQLLNHESVRNLIRVFFLRQEIKNAAKATMALATHIHVEGGGVMGGDIAAWCALQGFTVTIHDNQPKALAATFARACELFEKKLGSQGKRYVQAAKDRLILDWQGAGVKAADIIIEAIIEDLNAKQALFQKMEQQAKPTTLFATNTSSIELQAIGKALKDPSRLVGIHFFNPVAKMPLVEVVQSSLSSPEAIQRALAFVASLDKLPLLVKDSPGFLVNRVLMPYLLEAMKMMNEGIPARNIDKAAVQFGMPMGPVELADTVGLDICLHVAENLTQHFGGEVPKKLSELVTAGHLGRKTGQGFYRYDKKGKIQHDHEIKKTDTKHSDLAKRLIDKMIKEGRACLQEHIVASADDVDAGMIFGAGFAPFRGGPLWYADHQT